MLSLSDRAPSLVPHIIDLVVAVGQRFEAGAQVDVFDVSQVPGETDQIGHAVLWGSGMFGLGYLLRRSIPVAATACFLLAASIAVEFLQMTWTATRQLQVSDALANGVGIALATIAVIALGAVVDLGLRIKVALFGSAQPSSSLG